MDYELIREARLRYPFRPFFLKTKRGRVFFVGVPEHLAVAPKVVIVHDHTKNIPVQFSPLEVEAIIYTDEASGAQTDGR
jgi:hypothetical protein